MMTRSNPHKGRTGLNRVLHAAGYSADGLTAAWRHEAAFRQELVAAVVLAPAAWWLGGTWVERALLLCSLAMVLITELLNSAVEAVVDRVGFELHDLSKRAKDYGSAAVLLALVACGGVWVAALWQRLTA